MLLQPNCGREQYPSVVVLREKKALSKHEPLYQLQFLLLLLLWFDTVVCDCERLENWCVLGAGGGFLSAEGGGFLSAFSWHLV